MANPNRYLASNVGTTPVVLTTAASNTAIIAVQVTNKTPFSVLVDLYLTTGGTNYYYMKNLEVLGNNAMTVMGSDSKHFLVNTDVLSAVSNTANGVDVIVSAVENTGGF